MVGISLLILLKKHSGYLYSSVVKAKNIENTKQLYISIYLQLIQRLTA